MSSPSSDSPNLVTGSSKPWQSRCEPLSREAVMPTVAAQLRAISDNAVSARLRAAISDVADRLELDIPLTSTMRGLPRVMRQLIERHGNDTNMISVLPRITEQLCRREELQRGIWRPLIYPIIFMGAAASLCTAVLIFMAPLLTAADQFSDAQDSRISFRTASGICWLASKYPQAIAIGYIAIIGLLAALIRFGGTWLTNHRWFQYVPWYGTLFREAALAEFLDLMAAFISAKWSVAASVREAGTASEHQRIRQQSALFAHDLENGISPETAALTSGLPWTLGHLMNAKPASQLLSESLQGLGESYAMRAEERSRHLSVLLIPTSILLFTFVPAAFAIALMQPILFPIFFMLG